MTEISSAPVTAAGRRVARILPWLLVAACGLYVVLVGGAAALKLRYFATTDFDLAVHTQSLYNLCHGRLDCSLLGIPFLGNHMVLILFVLAPLFALFPSAMLLLNIQTLALAAGAWGVWLIARRELPATWAFILGLAYLLYPPLATMNLYEFHPVALTTPLLLFMLWAYEARRALPCVIFGALALSCQENLSMIVAAMGLYALMERRRWPWVVLPLVAGVAYFGIVILGVMPRLNQNTIQFYALYGHLGDSPASIVAGVVRHPLRAAAMALAPEKRAFLNLLLGPLGYTSLLSPMALFALLPVAAQRLLSGRATESSILFHYQAEFIPFVFYSAVFGLRRLRRWLPRHLRPCAPAVVAIMTLLAVVVSRVDQPLRDAWRLPERSSRRRAAMEAAVATAQPDDAVMATFAFLPHLALRPGLTSLHHVYTGRHTLSVRPYEPPAHVDVLLMDALCHLTFGAGGFYDASYYTNLARFIEARPWTPQLWRHSVLALRSEALPAPPPFRTTSAEKPPPGIITNVSHNMEAELHLTGFELGAREADGYAPLTLYWKCRAGAIQRDYDVHLALVGDACTFEGIIVPGLRFQPPQSWTPGGHSVDRHRIPVSPDAPTPRHAVVNLMPLQ